MCMPSVVVLSLSPHPAPLPCPTSGSEVEELGNVSGVWAASGMTHRLTAAVETFAFLVLQDAGRAGNPWFDRAARSAASTASMPPAAAVAPPAPARSRNSSLARPDEFGGDSDSVNGGGGGANNGYASFSDAERAAYVPGRGPPMARMAAPARVSDRLHVFAVWRVSETQKYARDRARAYDREARPPRTGGLKFRRTPDGQVCTLTRVRSFHVCPSRWWWLTRCVLALSTRYTKWTHQYQLTLFGLPPRTRAR